MARGEGASALVSIDTKKKKLVGEFKNPGPRVAPPRPGARGQARGAQRVTLGDRQKLHVRGQVQVAREHLTKAQNEAAAGDLRDALRWGFASLEAAIDALAAARGMAIDEKHWKRTQAASSLHATGVLPTDLSDLHRSLNETRKAVFYDGEDLDPAEVSIEDVLSDVEGAVVAAEAEAT